LNKFILLSDLEIHREQLNYNCQFFNIENEKELASLLEEYMVSKPTLVRKDYTINIREFAVHFLEIMNSIENIDNY
jgi:hypothetical protein